MDILDFFIFRAEGAEDEDEHINALEETLVTGLDI